jgi:hypothetical protein
LAVKIVRQPKKIALIGAPSSAAAFQAGSEKAPAALRAAGIVEGLQSAGFEVTDYGDCAPRLFADDEEHRRARNLPAIVAGLNDLKVHTEVAEPDKLSFLTQTTLSLYDTQEIVARLRQKFPAIKGPASDDICYATQNRQEAVEQVAKDVDFILVVGSPNSSNSNRLVEVAQRSGVKAQLIDSAKDIDPQWLEGIERVGLTAGASAPEVLVEQVSSRLAEIGFTDQRDLDLIREDVRFTLPPELATIAAAPRR